MLIFDALAQDANENVVVKAVKASLDVSFNHPFNAVKSGFDFGHAVWQERLGRKPWEQVENVGS